MVMVMVMVVAKSRYYKEGNVQSKKCQAIRQHSSWAPCS